MNDKLSFDKWWEDFEYQFRNHKDGGVTKLKSLKKELFTFSADKQIACINELLERPNLEVYACELIPIYGNDPQAQLIKNRAKEFIDCDQASSVLLHYFNLILKTNKPEDYKLIEKHYLNSDSRIPTGLYHIDKKLFKKAFVNKLKNHSVELISKSDNFIYLAYDMKALAFLINELPCDLSKALKQFAKTKASHSMIAGNQELSNKLLELSNS